MQIAIAPMDQGGFGLNFGYPNRPDGCIQVLAQCVPDPFSGGGGIYLGVRMRW